MTREGKFEPALRNPACATASQCQRLVICTHVLNKKAVLSQGNRAML